MKTRFKILIALVLILLILAGGAFWAAKRTYDAACVQQRITNGLWQTMRTNAQNSCVTVTELGETVGTYDLQALGLLSGVLEKIDAQFDERERMNPTAFEELDWMEILLWYKDRNETHSDQVLVDASAMDGSAILEDLQTVQRTTSVDEAVWQEDSTFFYTEPVQGNTPDYDEILSRVQKSVGSFVISVSGAASDTVAVTKEDYVAPALLSETEPHSAQELFERTLQNVQVTVKLGISGSDAYVEETLDRQTLSDMVSMRENGTVHVDMDKLQLLVDKWKEVCCIQDTPYLFNSYDDGIMELDFANTRVDYQINEFDLKQKLQHKLLKLESCEITEELTAYRNGEELDLSKTCVEVNIDRQTITYYQDGELIVHSDVVTGNLNGHETPTGLYAVQNKETDCWLSGEDFNVFVRFWAGFNGAYGIHDAQWRSHFGGDNYVNNGSHGCVNTPDLAMEKIVNTIDVGAPVLVHGKNKWYQPNLDPNED